MEGSVSVMKFPDQGRKLSDEEFKERLKSTYGEEYLQGRTFLSESPELLKISQVYYLIYNV